MAKVSRGVADHLQRIPMSADRTTGAPRSLVEDVVSLLLGLVAEQLANGQDRLPPESQLAEELGVSRNTLRAALDRLEADGMVERRRRVGTIITHKSRADEAVWPKAAYPIDVVQAVSEFFVEAGLPYTVRSVTLRREEADAETAEFLGIEQDEEVYQATRVYESKGLPVVLVEHRLPKVLNGVPVRISALADGVTTFLHETQGIRLSSSDHRVTAVAADPELAQQLEVPLGTPLLRVDCRLRTAGTTPVAVGRLVFRSDQVALRSNATVVISPPPAEGAS